MLVINAALLYSMLTGLASHCIIELCLYKGSGITEAADLVFSGSTMFAYLLTAVVYLAVPIAAVFVMRGCGAVKWLPVIAGVIMYFISTRLCDLTVWITLFSAPFAVKQAAAVELICIFEETGRWLAMKYPLFNIRSPRSAVCYGIGHAGLECWMRGISTFGLIGTGNRLNREGLSSFIEGKTPQAADAAMKELQMLTDKGIINGIADSIEVITNFGFHIALSLLIFKKMGEPKFKRRWLLLAIGLHYALNCISWVTSLSGIPLLSSIFGIITGAAIIILVYRLIDGRSVIDEILYPMDI